VHGILAVFVCLNVLFYQWIIIKNLFSFILVYKVEKVGEQAYRLLVDETEFDSEDDRQAHCLHGLWLERGGGDSGSESEDEFSASSGVSDHASPVPDDTHCEYIFYSVLNIPFHSLS
jgi:hypothetical protein